MKIHLLDGTYELFRSFYGAPSRLSPSGQEVGATRGILNSFLSLLRQPDVTHVACAFDTVIESFRNQMFEGYKTGEGIDPELHGQFELVEKAVRALGITVWSMVEFEADDALATAAAKWIDQPQVDQIVLCSPDKDLAQCVVGQKVVCLDRRREILMDEAGVVEKFGISPASIPDWLALVGDAADGIPGLKGWGAKSAATVLASFQHIEKIPANPEDWGIKVRSAARLAETLENHRPESLLYRRLATLRCDVPLTETLSDLEWRGALLEELEAVSTELGDDRLLQRVPRWQEE
ncbi:MAG: flap endonuclease [Deltaproteobacteria bacterium]|nr:flap endonuclease [Deltaproteobacteria bacterium]